MPSARQDGKQPELGSRKTLTRSSPADRSKLLSLRILQHLGCFVQVRACLGRFPSFAKTFYHLKMIPKVMP